MNLAVQWSEQPELLKHCRTHLREAMKASPLMDRATYRQTLSATYHTLWKSYIKERQETLDTQSFYVEAATAEEQEDEKEEGEILDSSISSSPSSS